MSCMARGGTHVCPITNEKSRLTSVQMLWPAERVSRGWISEGYSHANGPHDLHITHARRHLVTSP